MQLNKVLYLYPSQTIPISVVEDSNGTVSLLTSLRLSPGTVLYDENGDQVMVLDQEVQSSTATFYESRTEAQTLKEDGPSGPYDFGWRAKHLGWKVTYENGLSLYGDLASVNQNRQNVGIQGPSSTAGTDGSPAVLTQKVSIANAIDQVNGWKSFDSPNSYVLDAADVQQVDSAYVYADAFVQWTADSSAVSVDTSNLVEYSPTNSIVYTDFT